MAFNWQSFKTRTLTAAIFVVVMLAGLLINRWTFFILFSVIHFGCWWEYLKLVEKIHQVAFHKYFKLGLLLIGYGLMGWIALLSYDRRFSFAEFLFSIILFCGFISLIVGFSKGQAKSLKPFRFATLGLFYISLSLGLLITLYREYHTQTYDTTAFIAPVNFFPWAIIASLWINDTMAYIIGSLIGKTQMSRISPKKTWEGTIGGIILTVSVIFLLSRYIFHYGILSYALMMIALIVSITGTFGDLLESKLKRMAGVKDSGHIMPGHGGFLDRFDSLLVAIPFLWLYVYFFM
jgi:phosphatidate cytidylyltransferase